MRNIAVLIVGLFILSTSQTEGGSIACENNWVNLLCSKGESLNILKANYGRSEEEICAHSGVTSCSALTSLSAVREACQDTNSCSVLAANSVFGDPCVGTIKYLDVEFECRTADSFRKMACERSYLELSCNADEVLDVLDANYGRTSEAICSPDGTKMTQCSAHNAVDTVREACHGLQSCSVYADNSVFGDPCVGTYKYLEVTYRCVRVQTKRKIACEDSELYLACPSNMELEIVEANYGRTDRSTCYSSLIKTNSCYSSNTLSIVRNVCEGYATCSVTASNGVFGNPCYGTYKYLDVSYRCKPGGPIYKKKACESSVMELNCQGGQIIKIREANYGRSDRNTCWSSNVKTMNCHNSKSNATMSRLCTDRTSCHVSASNSVFGDSCVGSRKYLEAAYTCVRASLSGGHNLNLKFHQDEELKDDNYEKIQGTCKRDRTRATGCDSRNLYKSSEHNHDSIVHNAEEHKN